MVGLRGVLRFALAAATLTVGTLSVRKVAMAGQQVVELGGGQHRNQSQSAQATR